VPSADNGTYQDAPTGLQLDLLTVVARLAQLSRGDIWITGRLLDSDLPRLRRHLTPETVAWADQETPGWDRVESSR
jgi:hypothetical protein